MIDRYRQRHFHCCWFLALVLGAYAASVPAQTPTADMDPAQVRKKLEQVKSRIKIIQARLRERDSARDRITRELEISERRAAKLVLEGRRLASVRGRLDASVQGLEDAASRLRQQWQRLRGQLARQLRVAYALGREGRLKLILNGQEPGDLPRMLRYHDYFSRARRQRIEALNSARRRLDETLDGIASQQRRLEALAARQRRQARELAGERQRRAAALARTERELSSQRQRLASLEDNQQRLSALLEALQRAIDDIPADLEPPKSFRALRGKLPWPVKGRRHRRQDAAATGGTGVVIRAHRGREVRAITHGRVIFADWLRGFGQMIILDHADGYMSLYGYNQSLLREPGEWVGAGDAIATVGDSGGQSEPGLYFEIRRAGQPLDPGRWCSARASFKTVAR